MATQDIILDINTRLKEFKPIDIKTLYQMNGKSIEGDKEFILKDPDINDLKLKAIMADSHLEIKPIGQQVKSGEMYYDLRADGKLVRIKVICRKLSSEESK